MHHSSVHSALLPSTVHTSASRLITQTRRGAGATGWLSAQYSTTVTEHIAVHSAVQSTLQDSTVQYNKAQYSTV